MHAISNATHTSRLTFNLRHELSDSSTSRLIYESINIRMLDNIDESMIERRYANEETYPERRTSAYQTIARRDT